MACLQLMRANHSHCNWRTFRGLFTCTPFKCRQCACRKNNSSAPLQGQITHHRRSPFIRPPELQSERPGSTRTREQNDYYELGLHFALRKASSYAGTARGYPSAGALRKRQSRRSTDAHLAPGCAPARRRDMMKSLVYQEGLDWPQTKIMTAALCT